VRLAELAARIPGTRVIAAPNARVDRATHDSRRVEPGDIFVAIAGATTDGNRFVTDAIGRGATAVATEASLEVPPSIGVLHVHNAREALGDIASVLAGEPSERLRLVGVTGTDGKTTTSQLIASVLAASGRRVGWLTTTDLRIGDELIANPFGFTTPEATEIQQALARMVEAGVEDAVLEVSSHALALDRVRGCTFDAAVFTNLAPEHLNFHGSMAEYAAAKARLFEMLDSPTSKRWSRMGVVNADDPASLTMVGASPVAIVSYGIDAVADVTAKDLRLGVGRTRFLLVTPIGDVEVETRFTGRHNVSNWLAAAAVALGWGIDIEIVAEAAAATDPPLGRMQRIQRGQPFEIVVDFAHTPQALETTLDTLRTLSEGRILLVFGMAGGRDAANRPIMGRIAATKADFFVISTDDPMKEDPTAIAQEVAAGARDAGVREGEQFRIELDRAAAIREVLSRARPGDVVLLAGKGHERRMLIGDRAIPWSDEQAVNDILTGS
jgi:UDP-N-acetylmuramyl-tripeptide synthetase